MAVRIRVALCGLAVGVLVAGIRPGRAEEGASGKGELLPIPAPPETRPSAPQPYGPRVTYGPLRADDMAERAGRAAIDRQALVLPYIYAYAPPRVARRIHREWDRFLPPIVSAPRPYAPGQTNAYPPYPGAQPPPGYQQVLPTPNGYAFRPRYPRPLVPGPSPTPAVPQTPTPAVPLPDPPGPAGAVLPGKPAAPILAPPTHGGPDQIPAPWSEPEPREF